MSNPSLRIAATGMVAQQRKVESIAHNIANVNTQAFKKSQLQFEDLLYQQVQGTRVSGIPGTEATPAIQMGRGVRVLSNLKDFTQGALQVTNRQMDIAISGEGFLQVQLPDGTTAYTRDGSLMRGADGQLTTQQGYLLSPQISIPSEVTTISIGTDGVISGSIAGSSETLDLGRLELASFVNPSALSAYGQNLYLESAASGAPDLGAPQEGGLGLIQQGALEGSNVEIVSEMVDMITAQRAFEINSRVVQAGDRMMEQTSGMVR